MDDENLRQEGYYAAFRQVIIDLDPKAADFSFQLGNLRIGVRSSPYLTASERRTLAAMLEGVYAQSKDHPDGLTPLTPDQSSQPD